MEHWCQCLIRLRPGFLCILAEGKSPLRSGKEVLWKRFFMTGGFCEKKFFMTRVFMVKDFMKKNFMEKSFIIKEFL